MQKLFFFGQKSRNAQKGIIKYIKMKNMERADNNKASAIGVAE